MGGTLVFVCTWKPGGEGKTRETYGGRKFITQNPRGVHAARQVHAPCVEFTPNRGHSTTDMGQLYANFKSKFAIYE